MHLPRPRLLGLAALTAAGALLAACGSSSAASQTSQAASAAKVPLVVYSAQGYDSAVTKAFQAATGITVQLDDDSTGPLVAKIEAEKNNPQWGLLWVDGATVFASLDQQGMLLKHAEPNVRWNAEGSQVVPSDGSYVPTGVTAAGTLVYDTRTVSSPPTSWQDLLSSQWKGAVGMNDPAVSGPTYPFVAGMMHYLGGQSQGEQFFSKLKANGLHVFQTNGDTLNALEAGQIKLALIQSSAGIGASIKTPTIKTAFLPPVTLLPSAIGIDAHVSKQEQAEAKQFAAWVLSPAGQQAMQSGDPHGDSLYWPVVSGTTPLSQLPTASSVTFQSIDPYAWGSKEAEINTWFTDNISQ